MDPRELALLYKNFLVGSGGSKPAGIWAKHFISTEVRFDFEKCINDFKHDNVRPDINTISKVEESKLIVAQILEYKNRIFLPELKKPQLKNTKTVNFQYSIYSPFSAVVKKDKSGGTLLKDVVAFIQTTLVKLYCEQKNKKAIFEFFHENTNRKQIYVDAQDLE